MDDNLFRINPEQKDNLYRYTYFTLFGQHSDFDNDGNPTTDDEKKGFAYNRLNTNDKTEQYFLKVGLYGKIFNPIGLYSEGRENKFLSKVGKNEYNFTKVNKKVFDMYLNFLRTKNLAWLNNAERELS